MNDSITPVLEPDDIRRILEAATGADEHADDSIDNDDDSIVCIGKPPAPSPEELAANYKRHWTPLGNAERLLILFGHLFRFVIETGLWLVWLHDRWFQDTGAVRMHLLAKATLKEMWAHPDCHPDALAEYQKWIKKSENEPVIQQMIALTRSDSKVTISAAQLDQHPDLLACTNGVIDLRTGELRPNRQEWYLTRNTGVDYDPAATFPPWDKFVNELIDNQQAIRDFLQLAIGYSLQGSCREEKLFILHGPGATGKSTLLEAISGALGEYHTTAAFTTFLKKDRISSGGPSEDIARLAGARFVTASEVDDGQRFAEATLKQLTGGDAVNARFLYQNSFTFRPQFKLWFAVNYLPYMATDDPAMWRRILRIPCDHRPAKLTTSLKSLFATPEAKAAILAWAVRGAVEWYRTGLVIPVEIEAANAEAREDMDPIAVFLNEECLVDPDYVNGVTELRQKYEVWACTSGQRYTLARKRFNRALVSKGFTQGTRKLSDGCKHRCWIGLKWVGENIEIREQFELQHQLEHGGLSPAQWIPLGETARVPVPPVVDPYSDAAAEEFFGQFADKDDPGPPIIIQPRSPNTLK